MTRYQHLTLSIIFFTIILIEIIIFNDIIFHPYMITLIFVLGCVGGFNLGAFFVKNNWNLNIGKTVYNLINLI